MKLRTGEWLVFGISFLIAGLALFVGVMIYQAPPRVRYLMMDDAQVRIGETIYKREGCNACHKVFGNGYGYGPDLDGIGSRRTAAWLKKYLLAPWPGVSKKRYRLEMPGYDKLAPYDMEALVSYLASLRQVDENGGVIDPQPGG